MDVWAFFGYVDVRVRKNERLLPTKVRLQQEELYYLYDLDEQVAQLPTDRVREIVMDMHELMLKGTDEKALNRELKSKITKGKIKVVNDLKDTQQALNFSERERKRQENSRNKTYGVLKDTLTEKYNKIYDKETHDFIKKYRFKYSLILFVLSIIFVLLFVFNTNDVGSFLSFVISFFVNVTYNWYANVKVIKKKVEKRKKDKDFYIENRVKEEIDKKINDYE